MNGRRPLYFIASASLFVLVVVFAVYVVFMKFRPETEIQRMLRAMSKVETVRERSAFSWTRGEGKDRVAISLYLVGQVGLSNIDDLDNPNPIQQDTKFRLFRLKKSKDYGDISGEIRTVATSTGSGPSAGTTFLTYSPPGPDVPGTDFSSPDTWISFADGELAKWGPVIPGMDMPIVSLASRTTPNPSLNEGGESVSWTVDAILRLRNLLSVADVFIVRYDDVTEIVDKHATRVIEARFEPDAIRALLLDLIRAKENREPTDAERVVVESQASDLERLAVRLWIGIDDHLLYRFQAAGAVNGATIDVLVNLFDYGAPFDGEMPSPKRTTVFSSIYHAMIGSLESSTFAEASEDKSAALVTNDIARLPVETTSAADDADHDGLSATVEAFYQTNPNKADTDGDGKSDGEEVLSGQNPNGTGSLFGFGLGQ